MDTVTTVQDQDEDMFLMANVHPKRSGLPFVIYISEKQGRHDVRVKVGAGPKAPPVALRPEVHITDGELAPKDFDLVRRWIELNRDVIIGYWDRTIEDTEDALTALKRLSED
ncbi:MAG: hypothetical protein ABUL55_03170 [Pseudomonadota bacterium]